MIVDKEPMPAPRDLAQEIADRVGFSMETCQYKDRFWRHQWAKMIAAQIMAMRIPMSGQIACRNCGHPVQVSLHVDSELPEIPD